MQVGAQVEVIAAARVVFGPLDFSPQNGGFESIAQIAVGQVRLTLAEPQDGYALFFATPCGADNVLLRINGISETQVDVFIADDTNTPIDADFSIIAWRICP